MLKRVNYKEFRILAIIYSNNIKIITADDKEAVIYIGK